MPGPVSDRYKGPPPDAPYVPHWNYKNGAKVCPCNHHEGYHDSDGRCLFAKYDFRNHKTHPNELCLCTGIPADCVTSMEDM